MAPRRPRSTSNVSASTIPRAPTSSPQLKKQFALSIDQIYQNNITVLKRRDPTIVSILDQFSHVCLYHYNGKKWEKQGFEGSMFLVEHQQYPPYGMFILNRMGTGDYGRRLYPEDDVEVLGDYLMYRYYPDFTKKRLEMNLPYPIPPQYRPLFDREFARDSSQPEEAQESAQSLGKEKKGTSVTIGLWMFPSDAREPLKDVMLRLHSYIKRDEPYPEHFRYGPGRPPLPNSHLNRANQSPSQTYDSVHEANNLQQMRMQPQSMLQTAMPTHGQSEVDKLFAKLQPSHSSSVPPLSSGQIQQQSVQSLFAALSGQDASTPPVRTNIPAAAPAPPPFTDPSPATSSRGLALLGTIFASVSQPSNGNLNGLIQNYPQSQVILNQPPVRLPPHPEEIQIVSPKPQSSALPQILNQNVISTLLGLAPDSAGSRSSSAALSSSSSRQSVTNRYEGDNELSEIESPSDRVHATSSSIPGGNGIHVPLQASQLYPQNPRGPGTQPVPVQGDVTPRAFNHGPGLMSPQLTAQRAGQALLTTTTTTTTTNVNTATGNADVTTVASTTSTTLSDAEGTAGTLKQRTLVPFSSDSDLWPYPRAPVNDNEHGTATPTADDVIELDFSDTRALSDPNIFKEKQARQQNNRSERRRKSKKERAAEREKEREAIENGWDDPSKGQVTIAGTTTIITNGHTTPSPGAAGAATAAAMNGATQTANSTAAGAAGSPATNGQQNGVSSTAEEARVALLSALGKFPKAPARDISRKQFVQEVLSLIYSDNAFVDKLYEEYTKSQ